MKTRYKLFCLILIAMWTWPGLAAAQSGGPGQPRIHVVQPGETLFSIARWYGTTADVIAHANGIPDPRQIHVGQRLAIPGTAGATGAWATHVVRPGETLEAIAEQYGVDWQATALANQLLNPHLLPAGQLLRIPREDGGSIGGALHVIQPDETLIHIAYRYDVPFWELMRANGMGTETMGMPGQWLLIPGKRPSWMPAPFEAIELLPLPVRQGQALLVTVRTSEPVTLSGMLFDRPLQFAQDGDGYAAFVGVHAFTEAGLYELSLVAVDAAGSQVATNAGVVVESGGYGYERIDVPPDRTDLLDPVLVAAEQRRLEQVRTLFTLTRWWNGPFLQPVEAAVSSYFGTRRSYDGGPYSSYHAGVDFNAGMGAIVVAPASGTVVLAEPLVVRGQAVVIDHGWGVLSGFWHLSAIGVTEGQFVEAGEAIGQVGSTGLSTGAHLHWEVFAGGISVDGRQWLPGVYPWSDD